MDERDKALEEIAKTISTMMGALRSDPGDENHEVYLERGFKLAQAYGYLNGTITES